LIGGLWFLVAVAAAVIPLTAGFFQKRGESLMDLGQYDQALPSLRAAARIRPHDYKNHLLYGYCLYQQQHYGEALDAFHIARGLFPNFRNIIYDIAHVYQAQADGWERRAARLQANSGVDPKEIADALSALEQNLIQAVTSYEEALALDSRNLSARNNLALSYRRLAKFDRGRRAELTASLLRALGVPLPLTVEPNALLEQALSGIEVERDKQARELIEDSLLIHPHSPDLHNNLGVVLFSLGRYQQAFAAFLNVLELRNTVVFPQAILNHYSLLGELHFRIGAIAADGRWIVPFGSWGTLKFSALAESVPTIINSDRGGTFVWNDDLQVLELHFAEAPSAVQYIVEYRTPSGGRQFPFAQNDQVYAKAANNAGRCLELLDRAEEAEKYYRQALTITPAYPSPLRNLLRLLAGQELRQSEARQLLSQYVALDPELVDAPDLRPWAESLSSR